MENCQTTMKKIEFHYLNPLAVDMFEVFRADSGQVITYRRIIKAISQGGS